jgi:AraC-like DNA-binding protein
MKILESFCEVPFALQSSPDRRTLPGVKQPNPLRAKLPYNNESGLYFNYILDLRSMAFEYISRAFLRLTGYDEYFFKQGFSTWETLIYTRDLETVLKSITKHAQTILEIDRNLVNQFSDNCTFRINTRKGELRTLLRQRLYYALDESGNFLSEAGMFIDITRFKNDGNHSLVVLNPDGSLYLEYFPKEDEFPLIEGVRGTLAGINRLAGQTGNSFVRKTRNILAEEFTDKTFTVKTFGERLHISRSQLYRQLEKNAGITPNRLIRIYRLQQSLEHLARNELTISEVAWRVGFANPSWFSQCFNEEFDCTPSDYRDLMR